MMSTQDRAMMTVNARIIGIKCGSDFLSMEDHPFRYDFRRCGAALECSDGMRYLVEIEGVICSTIMTGAVIAVDPIIDMSQCMGVFISHEGIQRGAGVTSLWHMGLYSDDDDASFAEYDVRNIDLYTGPFLPTEAQTARYAATMAVLHECYLPERRITRHELRGGTVTYVQTYFSRPNPYAQGSYVARLTQWFREHHGSQGMYTEYMFVGVE